MRWTLMALKKRALYRWTAKSCGPDAPTLAFKSAQETAPVTVANKPGHKSAKEPVKTIARGMPGEPARPW
jgi:hypothetical protein